MKRQVNFESLADLTLDMLDDLKKLRRGEISETSARIRCDMAREILRAIYLGLQGAKRIGASKSNVTISKVKE